MNLVTGATGFIGSHIVRHLVERGEKVRAIRRKNSDCSLLKDVEGHFEWVEADVLDIPSLEDAMHGVQTVYHSAAIISFSPKGHSQMMKVNIEGTANVVNCALAFGVERLLHVSSISVFGRYQMSGVITEERKWKKHPDNTAYAISKHLSNREVWRGIQEGLPAVLVCPSTVLGFGDWNRGSCRIFKNIYDGLSFAPPGKMGFVAVKDVARASIELLQAEHFGEQYIINAENLRFNEVFARVAKGFGLEPPSRTITPFMAGVAWRLHKLKSLLTNQEPLVTRETARYTQWDYTYSNQKLLNHLPAFSFQSIDVCIEESCKQYMAKHNT